MPILAHLQNFTTQPENRGRFNGSNINMVCMADAFSAPQYQWARVDGEAIRNGVLGIKSAILSFNPLLFGDEGSYFCNTTSGEITLQSNLVTQRGNLCYKPLFFVSIYMILMATERAHVG